MLGSLILLFGCADQKVWHKPGSTPEKLRAAQRDCRDQVLTEMRSDDFYRRERVPNQASTVGRDDDSLVQRRFLEFDTMKRRDELFLDCMHAKGFSRVSRSPRS